MKRPMTRDESMTVEEATVAVQRRFGPGGFATAGSNPETHETFYMVGYTEPGTRVGTRENPVMSEMWNSTASFEEALAKASKKSTVSGEKA